MARGEAEVFLGATHDPQFGPMVLAGAGGVLVEFLQMCAWRRRRSRARPRPGCCAGCRAHPVWCGLRGRPAADLDAAAEALAAPVLARRRSGAAPRRAGREPDDPRAEGQGGVAVDARATLRREDMP